MANTSADTLGQLQALQAQLNPLMSDYGAAPDWFKEQINKKFNNNMPLLKEGAALEAGAYTLPGELMSQYDQQYGNTFGGASGMARLNSILGRLGNQFSLVDVASGLADQQGARINDLANSLTNQYGSTIDAMQNKYNMMLPIYQSQLDIEENAKNRALQERLAAQSRAAARSQGLNFNKLMEDVKNRQNTGGGGTTSRTPPPGAVGTNADGTYIFPSGAVGYNADGSLMMSGGNQSRPSSSNMSVAPKGLSSDYGLSSNNPLYKPNPLTSAYQNKMNLFR